MLVKGTKRTTAPSPSRKKEITATFIKRRTENKRYLITHYNRPEATNVIVFDVEDQRIAYRVSSNFKPIEELYSDIYLQFKRSETRIVEPQILQSILFNIEQTTPTDSFINVQSRKIIKEVERSETLIGPRESIHVRKVKETFKYVDRYKVNLQVKASFKEEENKTIVHLYDSTQGIEIGTHKLEYDYNTGLHKYWYVGKLIRTSTELEEIFK